MLKGDSEVYFSVTFIVLKFNGDHTRNEKRNKGFKNKGVHTKLYDFYKNIY